MHFTRHVSPVMALVVCLMTAHTAHATDAAAFFRVYLLDGTSVVGYGEPARIDDQVIVSMPIGGSAAEPQLHPVTLPAALVDWPRTERHAQSTRYQQYAPRAEADYERLADGVAAALNEIALSTDRARAILIAEEARRTLAAWPAAHFGYRQEDVREIVTLLDAAIARLEGAGAAQFEVSLVADVPSIPLEALAEMPAPAEQLDQIVRVLAIVPSAADRVALLQSGLALVAAHAAAIDPAVARNVRRSLERQLRYEVQVDERYARMTREMFEDAKKAAEEARIDRVERVLHRIPDEDAQLGRQRPDVVRALTGSVQAQLDRARRLRLLRDQWAVRQAMFHQYQRAIGSDMLQLVKAEPMLQAIRNLEGPDPERLAALRSRLSGGAAHLQRMDVPEYLSATHHLLVSAWRFAERAVEARHEAILSGSVSTAWQASSAAAGALMTLGRAQQEIRALLEPPTLP